MDIILVITLALVAVTIGTGIYAIRKGIQNDKAKKILGMNITSFVLILIAATIFVLSGQPVLASESAQVLVDGLTSTGDGLKYIGAALSTGMACIGAGIAVAATGSAAIGAISEDPKLLGKTIIFVGLSEGVAIYGFIISIMIMG
ncbi:MAG: ATPase [Vallitaleaceae bacterium]|nr:ATPase [Vallitaleaceae bacterium]